MSPLVAQPLEAVLRTRTKVARQPSTKSGCRSAALPHQQRERQGRANARGAPKRAGCPRSQLCGPAGSRQSRGRVAAPAGPNVISHGMQPAERKSMGPPNPDGVDLEGVAPSRAGTICDVAIEQQRDQLADGVRPRVSGFTPSSRTLATLPGVMVPSVIRSTPCMREVGGISGSSTSMSMVMSRLRRRPGMLLVVPPQITLRPQPASAPWDRYRW